MLPLRFTRRAQGSNDLLNNLLNRLPTALVSGRSLARSAVKALGTPGMGVN